MEEQSKVVRPRLPPGQSITKRFPILDLGIHPRFDPQTWDFRVWGEVENPVTLSWEEFCKLPRIESVSDFHCVTAWSRLECGWEGVPFKAVAELVKPTDKAHHVMVHSGDGYTTNVPLEALMADDVLLAYKLDGQPLPVEHGGPLRLVVPSRYGWKSAKWVQGLEFMERDRLGYWEQRGYSNTADPWRNDRYS